MTMALVMTKTTKIISVNVVQKIAVDTLLEKVLDGE
jgi:hypothetical protein